MLQLVMISSSPETIWLKMVHRNFQKLLKLFWGLFWHCIWHADFFFIPLDKGNHRKLNWLRIYEKISQSYITAISQLLILLNKIITADCELQGKNLDLSIFIILTTHNNAQHRGKHPITNKCDRKYHFICIWKTFVLIPCLLSLLLFNISLCFLEYLLIISRKKITELGHLNIS